MNYSDQTEDEVAQRIVSLGYALDDPTDAERVLNFRVRFNTKAGAFAAIRSIGDYNAFDGDQVADALDKVLPEDRSITTISVGREGSPVIYVGPFYPGDPAAAVKNALRDVHADELDMTKHRELRAWWD